MTRMQIFDSPLLLGFDHFERVLDRVSKASSEGYPPYNIEQVGEEDLRITLAVAGFTMADLDVSIEDNQLVIRGRQSDDDSSKMYLHRGIAGRQFQRSFVLAEGIEVKSAKLQDGLLHIDLSRPIPEPQVKKIKIENGKNINELDISILACYLPLSSSKIIINKLVNYTSKNTLFNDLLQMQIKDPLKENELKSNINSFDNISDAISKKVREQYEENPYPRWRYADIAPKNKFLAILNNNIKPNKIISKDDNPIKDVLIAGCGTGQQLVSKTSYENSRILAVDLSLSSLAFAKRKMQELNHSNVEFLHGDILNLKNLNRKFSVIECVGVLHHLKDPEKGLEILLDILMPKGYLKLGLYSEFARKHIVETRELVKKFNIKSNILDIRNFREIVKNDKDNKSLHKLNYNYDFYSTSNVRDLIFHVQEHRYTLPKIKKFLNKYDLEFLGFTDLSNKKAYSKQYPNDLRCISLENWNKFEINNPDIFKQMYQFWVKK